MMRHLIIYGLLAAALVCAPEVTVAQDLRVGGTSGGGGGGAGGGSGAAEARRQARLFDEHVVRMGETAFSIARGYAISPLVMAEDNPGLDPERLRTGQVVLIRRRERGRTEPAEVARQWQQLTTGSREGVTSETATEGGWIAGNAGGSGGVGSTGSTGSTGGTNGVGETSQQPGTTPGATPGTTPGAQQPGTTSGTQQPGTWQPEWNPPGGGVGGTGGIFGDPGGTLGSGGMGGIFGDRGGAGGTLGSGGMGGRRIFGGLAGATPRIALLLPLDTGGLTGTQNSTPTGTQNSTPTGIPTNTQIAPTPSQSGAGNNFTDFYKGALLALEELKNRGRSVDLTLYNSARSPEKTAAIVSSADFSRTDLVIGPVYENELGPALQFAEYYDVAVVSPLASIRSLDSPALWQMAPDPAARYDKLRPLLESDANIILIASQDAAADDAEFERDIRGLLGARNYGRFTIGGEGEVASLVDWERENVLVVLAGTEQGVDRALATISSSYNNASARRARRAAITVIGSSRWAEYGAAVDENLFFKLNVRFVTNYYIDRSAPATRLFEARYLEAYGDFPTRYSFRGYDTMSLFAGALFEPGGTMVQRLERVGLAPLGTPYRFVPAEGGRSRRMVNDQWTLVCFSSDYHITTQ